MIKDTNQGQTHFEGDGCGEPAHNQKKPKCKKCKDKIGVIICPCEVAPKYDNDYEQWKNK